jgi:hypothetical protein
MINHCPIDVKPIEKYRLLITFDNGEQRVFDVTPYLDSVFFAPLRNLSIFKAARINPLTVEWPGDIDFCPDELYVNSKPASQFEINVS